MIISRNVEALKLALPLLVAAGCGALASSPGAFRGDNVAPIVRATNPMHGATGMAVISAHFSEEMNASTITAASFAVRGPGGTSVGGVVGCGSSRSVASFAPTGALVPGATYTATITTAARDMAGNAIASPYAWSFTPAVTPRRQAAPALGDAGAFAVLAGSKVTNRGATALAGDLGVSPGTEVTGFPPATLSGEKCIGDVAAAAGMVDLTAAYDDVAGRSAAPVLVAGDLGGLTLPPGLYRSTSSLAISSADLTLDAGGDPNAVFIFQIAATLTATPGRTVILRGGARAANVFWQVGASATLGKSVDFKGTILARESITMLPGATLNGRALARTGAVTLAGNAVIMPDP